MEEYNDDFKTVTSVADQYESWPYPNISLFAKLHREQLWQINAAWLSERCGQVPDKKPRIWIVGCGTFQPYAFSRANPNGTILASDISRSSLMRARRRCKLHGAGNVEFKKIDLSDPLQFPEEKFDLIECYGVLMCLPQPGETLKHFARKLKPNGVLRLMVYPHYGRQRVFQIQRLAKLLGLNHQSKKHPLILTEVMKALPQSHPLSYAFFSYEDSKNSEGIVDGFLHASDRGFTGLEICKLVEEAGLQLGICMHRPWGQPREMAEKLDLLHHDPALWLHYLDLWQSLRTNFVLCLIGKESIEKERTKFHHPLFSFGNDSIGLRDKARLLKLSATGVRLESRTHESALNLRGKDVRRLIKGDWKKIVNEKSEGVLGAPFLGTSKEIVPNVHFAPRVGKNVPNPLYAHLFDAYIFADQWKHQTTSELPSLSRQIQKWAGFARPLEDSEHPFGLTPYGTYRFRKREIDPSIREFAQLRVATFEEIKLVDEKAKLETVKGFLKKTQLKNLEISDADLRELWFLLFSYRDLFSDIEG